MATPLHARRTRRSHAVSAELRRLIEQADRKREREVREIVALCRRRYPQYRAFSGAALNGLRQNVRYLVAGFYRRNLLEGRSPTWKELEPAVRTAQARAADGVPLSAMVGCYQLALPILWRHLVDKVGANSAVRMELLRRVPVTFASMARVMTVVTEAYVGERYRLLRSRGEALGEFVRLLIREDAPLSVVDAHARGLGLDLSVPRVAVLFRRVIRKNGDRASDLGLVTRLLAAHARDGSAIVERVEGGMLALVPQRLHEAALTDVFGRVTARGWHAGVGGAADDAAGLRRSAREAHRALAIADFRQRGGPVHRYDELVLHDLVDVGSARAQEFARRVLGPLARPRTRKIYPDTLRALCAHGFRLKSAAAALGVHPHTMSYRLGQMRRRFGINVGDAQTRMRIELALLILDA